MKKTLKERFDEKWVENPETGCWEWNGCVDSDGYGAFSIKNITYRSHRIGYELYCEKIPKGMFMCHKCDNPLCVNPDHLFLGTNQDNMNDMIIKGRSTKGTKNPSCKLTEEQVIAIFNDKRKMSIIAKEYGISHTAVSHIKRGKKWGWLTKDLSTS